jgi:hypothetical protein
MLRQIVGLKVIPLPLAAAGKSKVRLNVRPFSADSPDSGPLRPRCSTPHSETTTTARKRVFRLTVETTSENILATRIVCACTRKRKRCGLIRSHNLFQIRSLKTIERPLHLANDAAPFLPNLRCEINSDTRKLSQLDAVDSNRTRMPSTLPLFPVW